MVEGIGQALAGGMIALVVMAVLCVVVIFNIVLAVLKLLGVLLLSWWYIALMTPVTIVAFVIITVFILGFMALLGKF